jgi:hypothetical protein
MIANSPNSGYVWFMAKIHHTNYLVFLSGWWSIFWHTNALSSTLVQFLGNFSQLTGKQNLVWPNIGSNQTHPLSYHISLPFIQQMLKRQEILM